MCCAFWFVAACIFAGVFGWAYVRAPSIRTECVQLQLLPPNSSSIPPNGYFDEKATSVYRSTLPDECLPSETLLVCRVMR